jgi:DNA-binding transcriptional LysR family regulator
VSKQWWFPDGQGGMRQVAVPSRLRLDDLETIADAAVKGAGLAWLPCWLVGERLRKKQLTLVLRDVPRYGNEIFAVWPQNKHLPSKVRTAIDVLVEHIPGRLSAVHR